MNGAERILAVGAMALVSLLSLTMADEANHTAQQELCPVMEGNPIDRSIYVDHEGERVYFCCNSCKAAFEKEPDKYLPKLPQFTDQAAETPDVHDDHDHGEAQQSSGLRLHRFTEPLGIATFSFLALTLCAGLLRRKLKQRFLRIHKTLAFTTVGLAVFHVLTVLLGH